jgi:hypothetical protein
MSTILAMQESTLPQPWKAPAVISHSVLIARSYQHWLGELLLPEQAGGNEMQIARALYELSIPLMSHSAHPDPIISYANQAAQTLWRMEWDEFIGFSSRLLAEPLPLIQEERDSMLGAALHKGFVKGYSGRRVSKRGERFEIVDATIWNIVDDTGARYGQAVRMNNWWYI